MADILRAFEFCDLLGTSTDADLGERRVTWDAYVDTGAGRTVMSSRVARSMKNIPVPVTIEYSVPIRARCPAVLTAMRMLEDGCVKFMPVLCAVSDEVIRALDLPGGLEVLVGQDYLQLAHVRIDLRPKKMGGDGLRCRADEADLIGLGQPVVERAAVARAKVRRCR
jgi:hypothetical protein